MVTVGCRDNRTVNGNIAVDRFCSELHCAPARNYDKFAILLSVNNTGDHM
ncbi:MAG: hypothetical protein LIO85_06995 [Rikenellaceae bacterium]|nr:hypothetical protein [Rikenellaceae bacterium]